MDVTVVAFHDDVAATADGPVDVCMQHWGGARPVPVHVAVTVGVDGCLVVPNAATSVIMTGDEVNELLLLAFS